MTFQAKRELLVSVGARYREAGHRQKAVMLDEFVTTTGYSRKYAIRLLTNPPPGRAEAIQRPRARRYGQAVQEALATAWSSVNFICAKRLVPFLPELVPVLERHGHLVLTAQTRGQLLSMSASTADRLLRPYRQKDRPRGIGTTRRGALLKRQIPVRTFADWTESRAGFLEADLVAHCGTSPAGSFLYTLVLTDVASGWTECLALPNRGQHGVPRSLDDVRALLPFPMLGVDTDCGSEFINLEMLAYCEREQITFTRGRAYKKNGAIVRQFIGYDRFEGEHAFRQLTQAYRAVRLYVNFFQPSMKLRVKHRQGSQVSRTYDVAQTPHQRLLAMGALSTGTRQKLARVYGALDPVHLLRQIQSLQDALWRHAVPGGPTNDGNGPFPPAAIPAVLCAAGSSGRAGLEGREERRRYHRSPRPRKPLAPRTWRTRQDPFAAVREEIDGMLAAAPERTARSVLDELQGRHPGRYGDALLRTLQRRVNEWRWEHVLRFDDRWLDEEMGEGRAFGAWPGQPRITGEAILSDITHEANFSAR
jgi:hypothetical protein